VQWLICGHAAVCTGGFIKTIIRVLRCVGHFNSKLLVDKVNLVYMLPWHAALALPLHNTKTPLHAVFSCINLSASVSASEANSLAPR
jgi:hypothetical protein